MSTPLTDRITALTAQANAVTGASDITLTDAVGRLCEGYGGNIPSVTPEGMKTYFEEQGFVFSDFVISEIKPASGAGYMSVSHNLGSVPTEIIAFRKIFESNYSYYQVGITCSGFVGIEDIKNRTFSVISHERFSGNDVLNGYIDTIITNERPYIMAVFSDKNFCRAVSENTVEIRNQNANYAKPLLGEWWLGVR